MTPDDRFNAMVEDFNSLVARHDATLTDGIALCAYLLCEALKTTDLPPDFLAGWRLEIAACIQIGDPYPLIARARRARVGVDSEVIHVEASTTDAGG